jgi:hypothetical protein
MTDQDLLFIWTFDHGSTRRGHSTLNLMDGKMPDRSFARLVDQVPCAYRIICMQQCRSGGFIDDLRNDRTVILTACAADENAHRADSRDETEVVGRTRYHHGEFNYYLLSALTERTPTGTKVNADADGDGSVTMREAFDFVAEQESDVATPQYDDGDSGLGERLGLSGTPL